MGRKPAAASSIEIRLLGSFRVAVDGETLPDSRWRQRKPALLLQRLALEPSHRLHLEQLMEMLWPEADADGARNSLHKTIHMVRSALEPDLSRPADSHFLVTRGQQLVLTAPERLWIDAEAFQQQAAEATRRRAPEAFESALTLYQGPLLPEEPYEWWVTECRGKLEHTYKQLLMELAFLYENGGNRRDAVLALQRLVSADPANEAGHRALMQLHAGAGDRQNALRQFKECSEALRRELDAEPEEATVALYQQILSGEVQAARAARLAVVPFENTTGDPELEYLSDGLTEIIIGSLSRVPRLHVMAHSTVSRYRGQDPRHVAASLNVDTVVTGTILQRRQRLLVRVEVVNATGGRVWGAEYEWPQETVGELQEEISNAITEQLGIMSPAPSRRPPTENATAYRLFLKGRHLWNKRILDAVMRSIEYFREAIEIDPEYALAWVGLADSYAKLGDVGVSAMPPKEAFSKAKIAAIRAVEIDSSLAEAHNTLAHLFMHDYEWREAEREFRSSLRLNSRYVTAHHWFAYERLMTGHRNEAFEEMNRALELDPLSLPVNCDFGELLYFARDHDRALEQYQKTLELDDHFYPAWLGSGRVLLELGRCDDARAALSTAKRLSGETSDALPELARAEAIAGNRDRARELLAQLNGSSRYVSPYAFGAVYAALGDGDQAFSWLARAAEDHAAWSIYAGVDPHLDPLRHDPRFPGILHRIGLVTSMSVSRLDTEASYDAVAEEYAAEFMGELDRKPFDRELLDRFAETVRDRGTVCEIGCGPGQIARYLSGRGVSMRGIDISAEMVKQAGRLNPDIPFERGNMLELTLGENTTAAIVCFYAMIHLRREEVPRALGEMWRVLQPGGRLLLSFHRGDGSLRRDEWYGKPVNIEVTLFQRDEMERYLQDAGFVVEEIAERPPYSFEYQTTRLYALAQKI